MKNQLQTIREALNTCVGLDKALTALDQIEAMAREQVMVDMVPPATARDRWMYEQGRLAERDARTHAAQQPQAETESVLIDGIAYDTPAPVAAELLRLHIEAKQPQAECRHRWAGSYAVPDDARCVDCGEWRQQPQAETDQATMAGLDASVNILSSLVDEQRQLLAEVDAVFGVDAHGIVLEDGDSALIDRVRAHLAATSEAKQPQAEAVIDKCSECGKASTKDSMWALYCVECIESKIAPALAADQPPAATVQQRAEGGVEAHLHHYLPIGTKLFAAPQQAEAVPGDVVRDAERYRFLAAHCRSTPEHWGGRWSIVIEGPCPERQDCEDAFDAAIDAAIAAQGAKT